MARSPAGSATAATLVIEVRVKPRSRASELVRESTGAWTARLQSPPVDGKANAELIALVAKHFGCAKSAVSIKSGASGRLKLVQIVGAALRSRGAE
jgi:uncharacterized protein (TIGR00251 family)